jgi:hypothetical protein
VLVDMHSAYIDTGRSTLLKLRLKSTILFLVIIHEIFLLKQSREPRDQSKETVIEIPNQHILKTAIFCRGKIHYD